MGRVAIGIDPHKKSNTAVVLDEHERVLAKKRFANDRDGYKALRNFGRAYRDRLWAVEGAHGIGLGLAQRLVADDEPVVDVPAKLSARIRALGGGSGRKTDDADAHAVAVAGLRGTGLIPVQRDDSVTVLRLLSDRRGQLVEQRIATVNRLHELLLHLVPGGAATKLSSTKARVILSGVRPRDAVGKARKQLALEQLADLERLDAGIKAATARIREQVEERKTTLTDITGVGPVVAARILADVADVRRFPSKAHFASYTGTAPIDASSGENNRHRLNRGGNRRVNHMIHIAAITQARFPGEGQEYFQRKRAAGKSRLEALRCLKRRISDAVYRALLDDLERAEAAGPGGHLGATLQSSAAGPTPTASSSDKSLPGPADLNATRSAKRAS